MWERVPGRTGLAGAVSAAVVAGLAAVVVTTAGTSWAEPKPDSSAHTTTPIKHVVVLFDENISFDHYFATYPYAANTDGTPFHPAPDTPTAVDTELSAGLIPGDQLPAHNPNSDRPTDSVLYTTPNPNAYQPHRLAPAQAVSCSQNHSYGPEQSAMNGGAMDKFVESTNTTCSTQGTYSSPSLVMDYFDGNTVTALWNYAQNYAMSDNAWDTVFGPSTPGALNLISGNTYSGSTTVNSDIDPNGDSFGSQASATTPSMYGANVGDLLNAKGVWWGWVVGGFADRSASHTNSAGAASVDYSPHHNPFAYYASTANPDHTAPADGAEIGHDGPANHSYDLSAFNAALSGSQIDGVTPSLPAVSFLKAPEAQDGHAGYSDPLSEQQFLTTEINAIQQSPEWSSTAIVVTYDDSDGWYDHVAPVITNASAGASGDTAICTTAASAHVSMLGGYTGRCGPSQRLPLLVISPYAKKNFVSHDLTNQASVLKFIEENWETGGIDAASSVPGSFDASAGSLENMFDWAHPQPDEVLLDSAKFSSGTTPNPAYGAVVARPPAAVAPVPAPVISVASHELTIPAGTPVPDEADFLTRIGATVDRGTLSVELSAVDASAVGRYPVTVTGSVPSTGGDVPAANPQVVTVQVAPSITVRHSTISFSVGDDPAPSYVRSLAGATIAGGTLDLPDLSSVDFETAGSYQLQLTGRGSGVEAIPAGLTIVVQSPPAPVAPPVITLAKTALAYPLGAAPTAAEVAVAAGVQISAGTLDPIALAGVDFGTPGTYTVTVSGSDGDQHATPAALTIGVVRTPTITVGDAPIEVLVGAPDLTSARVLAESFASISSGALDTVDLSSVDVGAAGSYQVSITGQDRGVAAAPVSVTVEVTRAVSTTTVSVNQTDAVVGQQPTLTVSVRSRTGPATGQASVYDGAQLLQTVTLTDGGASVPLAGLGVGTHLLHATYLGAADTTGSASDTVTVSVAKAPSKVTLKVADRSLRLSQRAKLTVTVSATGATATGRVTIYDGHKVIKRVSLAKGQAVIRVAVRPHRKHRLRAYYDGSATIAAGSSSTVEITAE
jgi:phospholipase C